MLRVVSSPVPRRSYVQPVQRKDRPTPRKQQSLVRPARITLRNAPNPEATKKMYDLYPAESPGLNR